jgi:hypothetical protein
VCAVVWHRPMGWWWCVVAGHVGGDGTGGGCGVVVRCGMMWGDGVGGGAVVIVVVWRCW